MKYNININQLALASTGVDLVDAALLDYLAQLAASNAPGVAAQRLRDDAGAWTWANYDHIIEQMPMLGLTTRGAVSKRLQKLAELGFIGTKQDGRRLFYRMAAAWDATVSGEQPLPASNSTVSGGKQNRFRGETYNSTKDNNTTDTSIKQVEPDEKQGQELTQKLHDLVLQNYPFLQGRLAADDWQHMEKLHRLDGRQWELIAFMIEWCQRDEFWKQNIRTAKALRRQFDTLLVRAKSDLDKRKRDTVVKV